MSQVQVSYVGRLCHPVRHGWRTSLCYLSTYQVGSFGWDSAGRRNPMNFKDVVYYPGYPSGLLGHLTGSLLSRIRYLLIGCRLHLKSLSLLLFCVADFPFKYLHLVNISSFVVRIFSSQHRKLQFATRRNGIEEV